ncbi:hypothetical protein C0991_005578 [Blastosporella zonata]|nr:hypothetical protein C0991_005578 [Blastosporella zonata]
MPPKRVPVKRKHNEDSAAEAAPSTRATRSSTRNSKAASSSASTSKSADKKTIEEEGDQLQETEAFSTAKKMKTTKASTKATTAATKTAKASTKKSTASSSNDDNVILQTKGSIPEATTPSTISEPPASAKKQPPPSRISSTNEPYTPARGQALFKEYEEGDEPNTIGSEGFVRLCSDANFAMDGSLPLILAWQLGTKEMMKITAEEWRKGTQSLQISSLPALALAVNDLADALILNKTVTTQKTKTDIYDKTVYLKYCQDKKASFNKLYMFCFTLVKPE